jgi:hypothetical protein
LYSTLLVMFEVRDDALGIAEPRAWGASARSRLRELGLAIGVQRVVDGPGEEQLFVIVGDGQLKAAD